jgi:hypothetical protein
VKDRYSQLQSVYAELRSVPHARYTSRRALRRGYRWTTGNLRSLHRQGGPPRHDAAICALCNLPLRQIWDIDLSDDAFSDEIRQFFPKLTRLPIYFCCLCWKPTQYLPISDDAIVTFRPDAPKNYDSLTDLNELNPYREAPRSFKKKRIAFEPIPDSVEGLLSLAEDADVMALSVKSRRILSRFVGQKITSSWDLPFSQIGGLPLFVQGSQEHICPNPKCVASKMFHPFVSSHREHLMKELAVITDDVQLSTKPFNAQIAVHVCKLCKTIHCEYRCS